MPTYEYKCKVCDERFEIEQSFSDDALTTLEGCQSDESGDHQLKKVFAAPGIAFKGSGFYKNDSRSSKSSASSSSTATPSGGETNGSGSADKSSPSESKASDAGTSTPKTSTSTSAGSTSSD